MTGDFARMLMLVGAVLLVAGALLALAGKIPWLGRLPGDIYVERDNFRFYFPLATSIPVKKGYVVALTVPTWAPALTQSLTDGSSWRASRAKGRCDDTDAQTAQTRTGQRTQYRCLYKARLTYSATLITNPRPNKTE